MFQLIELQTKINQQLKTVSANKLGMEKFWKYYFLLREKLLLKGKHI